MSLEILLLIYCAVGAFRSRRKQISLIVYRLIRNMIIIFTGAGLLGMIEKQLTFLLGNYISGSLTFLMAFILPLIILRLLRKGFQSWIDIKVGPEIATRWGLGVGIFNNCFTFSALLITFYFSAADTVQNFIFNNSLLIRLFVSLTPYG
jgi:hypothetical protein